MTLQVAVARTRRTRAVARGGHGKTTSWRMDVRSTNCRGGTSTTGALTMVVAGKTTPPAPSRLMMYVAVGVIVPHSTVVTDVRGIRCSGRKQIRTAGVHAPRGGGGPNMAAPSREQTCSSLCFKARTLSQLQARRAREVGPCMKTHCSCTPATFIWQETASSSSQGLTPCDTSSHNCFQTSAGLAWQLCNLQRDRKANF